MKFQKFSTELININILNESLIHCISQLKDLSFHTLLLIADEKCIFEQVCVCVCQNEVFEILAQFPKQKLLLILLNYFSMDCNCS